MTPKKFKFYSFAELSQLPDPEWQIAPLFSTGQFVGLYGPAGDGKSFVALDMALSISQGALWQGKDVKQGAVAYVAAEGGHGISQRINAWCKQHGLTDVPRAFFLLEAVQLRDRNDLKNLLEQIDELVLTIAVPLRLIVVDTFARCFVGGEENSAKDVGEFVDAINTLQRRTGGTVMLIHHTGKHTDVERGSTAFRAAADVMIKVTTIDNGDTITVSNDKQKDSEEAPDIRLRLKPVFVGRRVDGTELTSCVLEPAHGVERVGSTSGSRQKDAKDARVLTALVRLGNGTATTAELIEATGLEPTDFNRSRKRLVSALMIESIGKGRYTITVAGRASAATSATANERHAA